MGGNWLTKAAEALPRGYFDGIGAALDTLRADFAEAAQKVYDDWEQDEEGVDPELGGGGICDGIAAAMTWVVYSKLSPRMGFNDIQVIDGGQEGDDHAFIIVINPEAGDAAVVDIPPQVYESGGGYSWKKIPGVKMAPDDIIIEEIAYEDVSDAVEEWGDEDEQQAFAKTAQWGDEPPALPSGDLGDAQRDEARRKKPEPETFDSRWQSLLKQLDLFLTGKSKHRYLSAEELLEDSESAIYLSDDGYSRILARFDGWKPPYGPQAGISDVSRPEVKEKWKTPEAQALKDRLLELMREFLE
jgi:hypothetical protein